MTEQRTRVVLDESETDSQLPGRGRSFAVPRGVVYSANRTAGTLELAPVAGRGRVVARDGGHSTTGSAVPGDRTQHLVRECGDRVTLGTDR